MTHKAASQNVMRLLEHGIPKESAPNRKSGRIYNWLGNSQAVASKHYLHTTDEHFEQATKAAQYSSESGENGGNEPQPELVKTKENHLFPANTEKNEWAMRDQHPCIFSGNDEVFPGSGAQSGAVVEGCNVLALLIELWPSINVDARQSLLAHARQLALSLQMSCSRTKEKN